MKSRSTSKEAVVLGHHVSTLLCIFYKGQNLSSFGLDFFSFL